LFEGGAGETSKKELLEKQIYYHHSKTSNRVFFMPMELGNVMSLILEKRKIEQFIFMIIELNVHHHTLKKQVLKYENLILPCRNVTLQIKKKKTNENLSEEKSQRTFQKT
jgi:hypothetical protein